MARRKERTKDKKLAIEFMVDQDESVGKGEVNIGGSEIDPRSQENGRQRKRHPWSQLEC